MITKIIPKSPGASLDYKFIWGSTEPVDDPWLQPGETISVAVVTVAPGLTKESVAIVDGGLNVLVKLSGGTADITYAVNCAITTNTSRTDDRTMCIAVQTR